MRGISYLEALVLDRTNNGADLVKHVLGNKPKESVVKKIDAGNCIGRKALDVAMLHYDQLWDQAMWQINKDMGLGIEAVVMQGKFSYFTAPISNTVPVRIIDIPEALRALKWDGNKMITDRYREILKYNPSEAKCYKSRSFSYCTFSGSFYRRCEKDLISHSGYMCLDFDHLGGENAVADLKGRLVEDRMLETKLLFVSPSGDGLKWVVQMDVAPKDYVKMHRRCFAAYSKYIKQTYGVEVDQSGKDIARACFIGYDEKAIAM